MSGHSYPEPRAGHQPPGDFDSRRPQSSRGRPSRTASQPQQNYYTPLQTQPVVPAGLDEYDGLNFGSDFSTVTNSNHQNNNRRRRNQASSQIGVPALKNSNAPTRPRNKMTLQRASRSSGGGGGGGGGCGPLAEANRLQGQQQQQSRLVQQPLQVQITRQQQQQQQHHQQQQQQQQQHGQQHHRRSTPTARTGADPLDSFLEQGLPTVSSSTTRSKKRRSPNSTAAAADAASSSRTTTSTSRAITGGRRRRPTMDQTCDILGNELVRKLPKSDAIDLCGDDSDDDSDSDSGDDNDNDIGVARISSNLDEALDNENDNDNDEDDDSSSFSGGSDKDRKNTKKKKTKKKKEIRHHQNGVIAQEAAERHIKNAAAAKSSRLDESSSSSSSSSSDDDSVDPQQQLQHQQPGYMASLHPRRSSPTPPVPKAVDVNVDIETVDIETVDIDDTEETTPPSLQAPIPRKQHSNNKKQKPRSPPPAVDFFNTATRPSSAAAAFSATAAAAGAAAVNTTTTNNTSPGLSSRMAIQVHDDDDIYEQAVTTASKKNKASRKRPAASSTQYALQDTESEAEDAIEWQDADANGGDVEEVQVREEEKSSLWNKPSGLLEQFQQRASSYFGRNKNKQGNNNQKDIKMKKKTDDTMISNNTKKRPRQRHGQEEEEVVAFAPTPSEKLPDDLRVGYHPPNNQRSQQLVGKSRRRKPRDHDIIRDDEASYSGGEDAVNYNNDDSDENHKKKKKRQADGSNDVRKSVELAAYEDDDFVLDDSVFQASGNWASNRNHNGDDADDEHDDRLAISNPKGRKDPPKRAKGATSLSFSKSNNGTRKTRNGTWKQKAATPIQPGSTFGFGGGRHSTFGFGGGRQTRSQSGRLAKSEREWEESSSQDTFDNTDSSASTNASTTLNGKRRSRRKSKTPEIVELSSDSEIEEVQMDYEPPIESELSRIAIGSKVSIAECQAVFYPKQSELRLQWKAITTKRTRSDDQRRFTKKTLCLRDGTLQSFAVYKAPPRDDDISAPVETTAASGTEDDDEGNAEDAAVNHLSSFIAMEITPTNQNGLAHVRKSYIPGHEEAKFRYIILEFRDRDQLSAVVDRCRPNLLPGVQYEELDRASCANYAQSLIANFCSEKRLKKRNKFVDGRPLDYTLLVYPFAGDAEEMESAARGLTEASRSVEVIEKKSNEASDSSNDDDDQGEGKPRKRAHFVSINVEDYDRLEPAEWLNDSLVDLWMQWISRDDTTRDSKFHFCTSHFFSTLASDGPEAVASWTKKKKINIFEKRLIFVPINKHMHWSLCAIVNPGAIVNGLDRPLTKDDPLSCMIFMDSLRMHDKRTVARHVRKWLNSEWQRVNSGILQKDSSSIVGEPFKPDNFKIFSPKVPLQNNTWDCGVFVCRYAYAIYELRHRDFTYGDAGMYCEEGEVARGETSRAFHDLISDGAEFDFNMADIARFREEFKTLIERLTNMYKKVKDAEKVLELEQKRQRAASTDESKLTSKSIVESEETANRKNLVAGPQAAYLLDEQPPSSTTNGISPSSSATQDKELLSSAAGATATATATATASATECKRASVEASEIGCLEGPQSQSLILVANEKENFEGSTETVDAKSYQDGTVDTQRVVREMQGEVSPTDFPKQV